MGDFTRMAFTPEAPRSSRPRDSIPVDPRTLFSENSVFSKVSTSSPKAKKDEARFLPKEESSLSMETSSIDSESQTSAINEMISSSPKSPTEPLEDTADVTLEEDTTDSDMEKPKMTRQMESVATLKTSPGTPRASLSIPEEELREVTPVEDIDRNMSIAFRQELLSVIEIKIDSKVGIETSRLSDPELNVIELFGRCLPDIVPNVILAKREVMN